LDASFSMWPVSYQGKWAISSSQNFLFVVASVEVNTHSCPYPGLFPSVGYSDETKW
jgi:hypothetical protein